MKNGLVKVFHLCTVINFALNEIKITESGNDENVSGGIYTGNTE